MRFVPNASSVQRLRAPRYRARHRTRNVAGLTVAAVAAALTTGIAVGLSSPDAGAAAGTVAGVVFEDYNANGVRDTGSNAASGATATDVGVAGANVVVTDSTGATVGTATTTTGGAYTVAVAAAATADVRVKITPPTGYTTGPHGPGSGSTVQFVALGSAAAGQVDLGVVRQGNYAQNSPAILNVLQIGAIGTAGELVDPTTKASLVSSGYGDRGTSATTTEALMSQTGSVWGVAQLGGKYAFTGAFFKRHVALGPGGLGQIYLTTLGGAPDATPFVTIPDAGTDPRGDTSGYTFDQWFHDVDGFTSVGKIGLGGIALAPDASALYTVNLNDKQLYRVPITGGVTSAPVAGVPQAIPLPSPGDCDPAFQRPFGVSSQNGAVWVTITCTGPDAGDLKGYVYRFDPDAGTFAPAFQMSLSGYDRGLAFAPLFPATWRAWPDPDTTWPITRNGPGIAAIRPEPLLSDVVFDSNGDMTIGIKDRFGDQTSFLAGNLNPASTSTYQGVAAGDTLRACATGPSSWTLESNGSCGARTGSGVGNGQGPGGGEFYADDYGNVHQQVTLGGLLQLPGYGEAVSTTYDPAPAVSGNFRTQGNRFLGNADGANDDHHQLLARVNSDGTGPAGSFGKSGGLGDLTALVTEAPIEIGNRVWLDSDFDGVQDPGEAPIAGVTVHLYAADGTTLIATAVTDANGNYYFSNSTVGTSTGSARYDITELRPNTDYVVRLDNPADYTGSGPLTPYTPTQANAGSDTSLDSNGTVVGGRPQADVHTGDPGRNNHTIDFGFTPPTYAVGDYVWFDANDNGIQDPGESPARNVTATLLDGAGNPAVHADGTPVAAVRTDADGHYVFDFLPEGDYQVQFSTLPAGYVATEQSASGSTSANDSNPDPATLRTPVFGLRAGAPDLRLVQPGDGTSLAVAINPTIDLGLVAGPSVSVGDFVWVDSNRDGLQDAGEPGIEGVSLTLTGPTGDPVTDIFGDPVGPATTDATGKYLFANLPVLPAGQHYTVSVDNTQNALAPYVPTLSGVGSDPAKDSSTSSAESSDLATGGAADLTLDFGFVTPSVTVGNFVWVDTNRDGIQDSGEPGISGVVLTITGPGGAAVTDVFGNPVGPATTDANGGYDFFDLPALPAGQHYTVSVDNTQTALTPYLPTTAGAGGDPALDSSTGSAESGDLTTNGASDLTLDFGFVVPAVSVGDFVWVDTNRDGVQDPTEPGISGVVVTLTDPNGDPVTDVFGNPVGPATTDANGNYTFPNLPALPAGQHYTVSVDNTQPALAPYVPTTPGAGGDTTKDSSTGSAESGDLTADGDSDTSLDFGFVVPSVSVGDFVWVDTNRNGVQDFGEPGVEGVQLTLTGPGGGPVTDVFGNPVGPVTTDSDGVYAFANLPALPAGQHYTVRVDPTQPALADYVPTTAGAGNDPARDSSTGSAESGDLTTNGASDPTLDFGFVKPAVSVGDFVWLDRNADGVQGSGEPGIRDVIVTLTGPSGGPVTDVNGDPVGPATTDANGKYLFANLPVLPAGQHYTTHVAPDQTALAAYVPTRTGQGTGATDSSTGSAESGDLTTNGASDRTLDFGFVAPVSVGDIVWLDANGNGEQDSTEHGIPGVVLTITDTAGRPVTDLDGNPVGPVTTDAGGHYVFANLPPGQYVVRLDPNQPALAAYVPTVSGRGGRALDSSEGAATSLVLLAGDADRTLDFGFTTGNSGTGPISETGVPVSRFVGSGLLLLLAGGMCLLLGFRRRSTS